MPCQFLQPAPITLTTAERQRLKKAASGHKTPHQSRGRFADGGLPALTDLRRSGRPARFKPVQVAEAKALACRLPAETRGCRWHAGRARNWPPN